MEFVDRAQTAVEVAIAALPAGVADPIREELNAGEEIAALIDLIEVAPALVQPGIVDELERHLAHGDDVFARVGHAAIAKHRSLATA